MGRGKITEGDGGVGLNWEEKKKKEKMEYKKKGKKG
jgi:hypothetical protein